MIDEPPAPPARRDRPADYFPAEEMGEMTPTRGERNCNPGNLDRHTGTNWLGASPDQSGDPRFVVFTEAVYGIRALAKVLLSYQRTHGLNTVEGIISRWAPGNENNTEAYIQAVCKDVAMSPVDQFDFDGDGGTEFLNQMVKAIIHHENGRVIYSDDMIADGVQRARA